MDKTKQCKLSFPEDETTSPEVIETQKYVEPEFQVSEIEITYNPIVKPSQRIKINSSVDAEKVFRRIWCKPIELRECFYAIFLNRNNKVLGYHLISVGGITGTAVDPRSIFQTALKANACSIILGHNHPSGNPTPSDADNNITRKIKEAGDILEIKLLDHIILLPEGYTSMADDGLV